MNIICQKQDLVSSINISLRAVSSKTTMPILECIVIEAKEAQITLLSNDMELGVKTRVKGEVLEEGSVAVDAKLLSDMIRRFPDSEVSISTGDRNAVRITCEKIKFNIQGLDDSEFPSIPMVMRERSVTMSQFWLKEVIRQTIFSISDSETTQIMTGELFEVQESEFRIVSLDGHRISIRRMSLKERYEPMKVVIPGKTLNEIAKILSDDMEKDVTIFFTSKHIVFEFDDTVVVSRLIEGEYYNVDQMISKDYETKIRVNKRDFLSCIERMSLLIKETERKPIIMNVQDGVMEVKIRTSSASMNDELPIEKEGKDIMIGFNPKFLMEAFRAIDDEELTLYLTNPRGPCIIRDKEDAYIYFILPVNFNPAEY